VLFLFLLCLLFRCLFLFVELQIEFYYKRVTVRPNLAVLYRGISRRIIDAFYLNVATAFDLVEFIAPGEAA
jgi:hypothetical protein